MHDFKEKLIDLLVTQAHFTKEQATSLIEIPPTPTLGDYAVPCFVLAKELKKNPTAIAQELAQNLESAFFERFEAKGPYLNAFINKSAFIKEILSQSNEPTQLNDEQRRRIIVEYMNANPNKPLHIGQARNICIGDSMIRLFRSVGNTVHGVNYGDDSGVNVGYNIVGHLHYGMPVETDKKFDHYCGEIYTQMRAKDDDPTFKKQLSAVLRDVEEGTNTKVTTLHEEYTRKCTIAQFESCWNMNAYFALINWETDILRLRFFEDTIERLKEKEHITYATEGDATGCWILDLTDIEEFKGLKTPYQILIKSDGVATYAAKDIVYALWKLGFLNKDFYYRPFIKQPNDEMIYTTQSTPDNAVKTAFGSYDLALSVIDNRQSHEQKVVKQGLKLLGFTDTNDKEYVHLPYGVVYLTPETLTTFGFELSDDEKKEKRLPFSSRKGWFITIDDTLELLKKKAYHESKKRNPDKTDEWLQNVAHSIAIGSFRFFLTKFDRNRDITFDIDAALDMEGETGAYVLYSYARIKNIFSQDNVTAESLQPHYLTQDIEFQIVKKISERESVVSEAQRTYAPNLICRYAIDLCQLFNSYYASVPVLKADSDVRDARLGLLEKLADTLAQSMRLIGMIPLERM